MKHTISNDRNGEYGLVGTRQAEFLATGEDEEVCAPDEELLLSENDANSTNIPIDPFSDIVTSSHWTDTIHKTLLSDQNLEWQGMRVTDSSAVVKFLKFIAVSTLLIITVYHTVRISNLEHNSHLLLSDLYMYESVLILQDAAIYFVVGRMYNQRGVDHLVWIGWCLAANAFSSCLTRFRFLQHSFTLYEIHCRWPWQLWVFVLLMTPIVVGLILLHVHRAVRDRVFFVKLTELLLSVIFFLVPYLPSKYLHIHHWFIGWLLGMHCNFDVWYSRAALAWCWGIYINGIAVYGRDPVLTCGYSYWLSEHMRCPYLDCYLDAMESSSDNLTQHVDPMIPPNWRNCSADSYHP